MTSIVLLGTLDTKGSEYGFLTERIRDLGCEVVLVDVGVLGNPSIVPDISRDDVARAAGVDRDHLVNRNDRGEAIEAMARGATAILHDLFEKGRLHGVLALGGTGGSSLATQAMRALPVGVPKLMVSTVASGDTRPYVGAVDITMMYSVVDIAGINRISARILDNAAAGIVGMAQAFERAVDQAHNTPLVAATMFGVTTPCVSAARKWMEKHGYEVLVFHATGTGGQSMEALITGGYIAGVLDITTTELADDLVGGVFSAGPDRLVAAGRHGVPQVVSLGALDMVNFGPLDLVPEQFRNRNLYKHNPSVTLMRTTPEECAELGRRIAHKLNAATGPTALFIPRRGVSAIAIEGGPFSDIAADAALINTLLAELGGHVEVHDLDLDINDPLFAEAMAIRLSEMIVTVSAALPTTRHEGASR